MPRIKDLERLINTVDLNRAIMELDEFIARACGGYGMDNLTEPQWYFYLIQCLEREVNNGGFKQFFWNLAGDFTMETVQSLTVIGAHHTCSLLQTAIAEFPSGDVPKDRVKRQGLIEQIEDTADDVWNALDEMFYKYQDDLNLLNMNYVKANSSFF